MKKRIELNEEETKIDNKKQERAKNNNKNIVCVFMYRERNSWNILHHIKRLFASSTFPLHTIPANPNTQKSISDHNEKCVLLIKNISIVKW